MRKHPHLWLPFNAHASQYVGARFFGYNSPAAAAREVFKPSTHSASLVVPSQKKNFSFMLWVLLGGSLQYESLEGLMDFLAFLVQKL